MAHYDHYFGATIFFIILQWITALGRCAIRIFIMRKFGMDDVAVLITLILSTAYQSCFLAIQVLTDGGEPLNQMNPNNLLPATNCLLATVTLYIVATAMLKVSLGLLLLRVLIQQWQILTVYATMSTVVAYSIFYFFFTLFQCGDPRHFGSHILEGQCLKPATENGIAYAHGILSAFADCLFAALPVILIRNADMSKRTKFSVTFILGLGSVGCICTFVRIGWIADLSHPVATFFADVQPLGFLSGVELSIGITCISLSCYKPVFKQYFWRHVDYYYPGESRMDTRPSSAPIPSIANYRHAIGSQSRSRSSRGPPRRSLRRASQRTSETLVDSSWPLKTLGRSTVDATTPVASPTSPGEK